MAHGNNWKEEFSFGMNRPEFINMNYWYIEAIKDLMLREFVWCWMNQNASLEISTQMYQRMHDALLMSRSLAAAKIDADPEGNLDKIKTLFQRCYFYDGTGKIIRFDPSIRVVIKDLLYSTHLSMIIKLEEAGLLTREAKDPSQAMGQFQNT